MRLRKERERRAPRRFEDELDQIYAPETPARQVIRPATRPARPAFHVVSSKPFNPNLPPAAFPSLPLDGRQAPRGGEVGQDHGATGDVIDLTIPEPEVAKDVLDASVDQHGVLERWCPSLSPIPSQQTQKPSLIVRLALDKGEQQETSLRELLKRVDSRQALRWTTKARPYTIEGFSDRQTLKQCGVILNDLVEEQYRVHSTLLSMNDDDADSTSSKTNKILFSSLHPMTRSTIIANMHATAIRERFPDPLFPLQHLLDLPAHAILETLDELDKAIDDDYYPGCLTARALTPALVHACRFLRQQRWPLRFLKSSTVRSSTVQGDELRPPYAPVQAGCLSPADHVFFGRTREVEPRDLNDVLLGRSDQPQQPTREGQLRRNMFSMGGEVGGAAAAAATTKRVLSEQMRFAEGQAQAELQRVRFGRREEQAPSLLQQQQRQERARQDQRRRPSMPDQRPVLVTSPPLSTFSPSTTYAAAVHASASAESSSSAFPLTHALQPESETLSARHMAQPVHNTAPASSDEPATTPLPSSFLNGHGLPEPAFFDMFRNSSNAAMPSLHLPNQSPTTPHGPTATNHPDRAPAQPATNQQTSYHRRLQEHQAAQALAQVSSLKQAAHAGALPTPPPTMTTTTATASMAAASPKPPAVIPTAPMSMTRTVQAHFAFPDRSNIMLPPRQVGYLRGGYGAEEEKAAEEDGFATFMRGVVEEAGRSEGVGGAEVHEENEKEKEDAWKRLGKVRELGEGGRE